MFRQFPGFCGALSLAVLAFALVVLFSASPLAQEQSDLATFRKLHDDLRERMAEDLIAATTFLEAKIAESPDSEDLNVLRQSLSSRLAAEGNFKAANDQLGKLLEFQIQHIDQSQNQFGIGMTIQSMQEIVNESGNSDALDDAVERAFLALTKRDSALLPTSQLVVLKARGLADANDDDGAKALVTTFLKKLDAINRSDDATSETMQAHVNMLRSLTSEEDDNDLWLDDSIKTLDSVVELAIEKFPDSLPLQTSYADTQLQKITRWNQDDPDAMNKLVDKTIETLEPFAAKNMAVRAALKRIELHKIHIASVKPKESLVGKQAPEWDIDAWVNTIDMQRDDLKGKVVLLDFWAMWCGPCIATFPHLKDWREEFGTEDFEIVGVTTYYNFEWDDDKERATRSRDEVSSEDERQAIASFLDHHKLKHPVIVTPEGSDMNGQYGVRGIPHVVLIDGDGVVQLVKTGAGEKTAKEIEAKIKELLKH
ncbi:MAG: TlpA disulfide reductase family protein [Pirellulaceae bacterium]